MQLFSVASLTLPSLMVKKSVPEVCTYYCTLANGKIVEDDPVFIPDLTEILGTLMPQPPAP